MGFSFAARSMETADRVSLPNSNRRGIKINGRREPDKKDAIYSRRDSPFRRARLKKRGDSCSFLRAEDFSDAARNARRSNYRAGEIVISARRERTFRLSVFGIRCSLQQR